MTKEGPGSEQLPAPICIPGPGEKILQDFQILVQKVGGRPEVLLIGETLEGKDIHKMMSSFVKDLFSAPCHPVHPAEALKEPCVTCPFGGKQCQLIFFLCRASCMKGKETDLRKVLQQVKKYVQKSPCALVGIIMEPKKGEAEEARVHLLRLLRGIFPKASPQKRGKQPATKRDQDQAGSLELEEVEVEAEVYIPGYPRGNLAIMKAACRASEALSRGFPEEVTKDPLPVAGSSWTVIVIRGILGTLCIIGMASAAGWYLYQQGMIPPDMIPAGLLAFI
ncbi:uncharacterized protein C2orf72 homolog [Protobothrops mucrosquamatus]|uniref:uncharacterized protein C2orf72 homolog n=1 Tax=Protobothrops mucrosquamatus TaxID=103944 RepID=UPI0010FBB221|nr:uncharacterized protein C2orf72 homolog [Protobothrops mucrosquamatus]